MTKVEDSMTRRLTPLQAYRLGFRRGVNHAWGKMGHKVQQWEDEIAVLQADYETLISDVRAARDAQAVREAANERAMLGDDAFLN